jgi:predicted aldo/keto reductase-like oxidoreductase
MPGEKPRFGRRKFVATTLAGAGTAVAGYFGYQKWQRHRAIPGTTVVLDRQGLILANAGISARRRLGRTGLSISVIGIGAGGLKGPEPIVRAVDKGMNFIDTSICYGDSEKVIAKALRSSPGLRKKLIIATKWDATVFDKKADILDSLDRSLKRLKTDVIDIMQIHWLGGGHMAPDTGFNRLDNPELYLAMEEAKKSGKVRFFGATSHAGDRGKILEHAIDKGAFDMLLVKMNVLDFEGAGLPSLLAKCKQKDIGVVVMKSQPGGDRIPAGYEKSKYSIFQANLRWVLQHPEVTSVVHSKIGTDPDHQDLAIGAVSAPLTLDDRALLDGYARALSPLYCRGCSEHCVSACPAGVAVPHIAQFDMYDRQYEWHATAREHYRALPVAERWSELCTGCDQCTQACPHGFDAATVVRDARRLG